MDRPTSRSRRSPRCVLATGAAVLSLGTVTAPAADARTYFEPPGGRAGDRIATYRAAEATTTVQLRWQNACYDRPDVICSSGEASYRDRIGPRQSYPVRGLRLIRRKPSFRTGVGYIRYGREATERITKRDLDHTDCTESGELRPDGLQSVMTYSLAIARGNVHIELESRLGLNAGCSHVFGMPPYDAVLRSAAVDLGPTFDVPLSRLRGKRVKLDLRDPDRTWTGNGSSIVMTSRLRLTLVRTSGDRRY